MSIQGKRPPKDQAVKLGSLKIGDVYVHANHHDKIHYTIVSLYLTEGYYTRPSYSSTHSSWDNFNCPVHQVEPQTYKYKEIPFGVHHIDGVLIKKNGDKLQIGRCSFVSSSIYGLKKLIERFEELQ